MLVEDALRVALYCATLFAIFGLGNWAFDGGTFRSTLDWREALATRRSVQHGGNNGSEELKLVLCRITAVLSLWGLGISLLIAIGAYGAEQLF